MKNKIHSTLALIGVFVGVGILTSCGDDDTSFAVPTIELSETATTAAPGDEITVTVTATTDAAFTSIVVTKLWDGTSQATETITDLPDPFTYSYTVIDDDADHILSFNFLITDAEENTATVDWVVTVELTAPQILEKHNWRLSDEIRAKTDMSDIQAHYQDDVYQFNSDGTFQKSNGPLEDGFNDDVTIYCFWEMTEDMDTLFMVKQDIWNSVTLVDTIAISTLTETEMKGDITYYGLDQLDETYDAVEEYEKQFVVVAKTADFDPYGDDDGTDDAGPDGECNANWKED